MGHLQKEGLRPNPETPKTILDRNSTYKICTKIVELPKLTTLKVRTARILNNLFSLFRWFQLLYMGPVFTVQLFMFLIQLSALFFFQSGRFLHTSSPRYFQKISSLTSIHCWGWVHQGDPTTFSVQLEGGVFPLGFPSFPHSICFWALFQFQYCIGWPMALVAGALAFLCILCFLLLLSIA